MAIKVFADGANLEGMLDMYENGNVQGFTTNPSLMKKGGVTDYRAFAKEVLTHITDVSVSFEVFADDVETMEVEAREIATWAENVYVKIPCVTTKGESTAELVRKLCRHHTLQYRLSDLSPHILLPVHLLIPHQNQHLFLTFQSSYSSLFH